MNAIVQIDAKESVGTVGLPVAPAALMDPSRAHGWPRSPIIAQIIIEEISTGKTLRQICREQGLATSSIYLWRREDDIFRAALALAREDGFDAIADEILEIVDNQKLEPAARKAQVWARLELLAKWQSGSYNPALKLESVNRNLNINVDLSADPTEAARQYSDIMRAD